MKWLRIAVVNFLVLVVVLGAMEIAARVYVAWTRGSQTAGVQERTVYRLRVSRPGEFYLSPTYALVLKRPFLAPFAYLLSNSQLYNGIVRLVQHRSVGSAEHYADAIPVYIESQRSLNVIAKGMGAARLMVLQPFSGFKTPRSSEEAAFELYR